MEAGAKSSGIAVIITVYNKEAFLRDAIESVLTQRLGNSGKPTSSNQPVFGIQSPLSAQSAGASLSIILCDDGSTDKSRDICADYAARYNTSKASVPEGVAETEGEDSAEPNERSVPSVSVYDITDGVHRGVVGNFLHCLEFALSLNVRYISQLDSDDILADPDFLLRQTSFLESRPEAQAACSSFFLIGEQDTFATAREQFSSNNFSNKASANKEVHNSPECCKTVYYTSGKITHNNSGTVSPASCGIDTNLNSTCCKTLSYTSEKLQHPEDSTRPSSGASTYRDLKITPEVLLTKNNTLVAGGVTYRAEHLKEYLETFASKDDATQDLPLWLFLSQKGSFWGTDIQSLAYRNLKESVSRSEDIETQLKFQQASLSTRLRFIDYLKNQMVSKKDEREKASSELLQPRVLDKLAVKANRLYQKKMLRHYAKLSPKTYPKQLRQAIKSNPSLLLSSDLWRSIGVWLKNIY